MRNALVLRGVEMLVVVVALFFQFSVFSSYKIQAAEKASQPAVPAEAVADSAASSKLESPAPSVKNEALGAEKTEHEAPVALAPGRLVAEPVPPVSPAPADPTAYPASPVAIEPAPMVPVYRPPTRAVSDHWQNRKWLALSISAHGAAGFDAWSTRRVISSVPQAQEANPSFRPFAGNASMYAAVQVMPTILDFLSRRMMNSRHDWARHTWWLPQAVSIVASLGSGIQNLGVYNSR
jgi:hypothetical protein